MCSSDFLDGIVCSHLSHVVMYPIMRPLSCSPWQQLAPRRRTPRSAINNLFTAHSAQAEPTAPLSRSDFVLWHIAVLAICDAMSARGLLLAPQLPVRPSELEGLRGTARGGFGQAARVGEALSMPVRI